MHYADLNPRPSQIVLKGKRYVLKPFTLTAQVWAYAEFATKENRSGLEVLAARIQDNKDMDCYLRLTHHLLSEKGKEDYPTVESLIVAVESERQKYSKGMEIYNALSECLGNSNPVKESEAEKDLKKSQAVAV